MAPFCYYYMRDAAWVDCAYRWLRYNWLSLRRHVDIEYGNDAVHRVAVRKVLVQEWNENVARVLKETKKQNTRSATPFKARNTTPPVTVVGIYSSKPTHPPTPQFQCWALHGHALVFSLTWGSLRSTLKLGVRGCCCVFGRINSFYRLRRRF